MEKDTSRFLFFTVVSSLIKKVKEIEPAKSAILKIMEAFSAVTLDRKEEVKQDSKEGENKKINSLFDVGLCNIFIEDFLPAIVPNKDTPMLFKTKKALLPCLLSVGQHLEYK